MNKKNNNSSITDKAIDKQLDNLYNQYSRLLDNRLGTRIMRKVVEKQISKLELIKKNRSNVNNA